MKKLTLILSALLLAALAQAEVAIYKQNYTETDTGNGGKVVWKFTGYFLLDEGEGLLQIDVNAKAKTFRVWDFSYESEYRYLRSSLTGRQLLIYIPMGAFGGAYLRGTASTINTGTINFNIPKTITISGTFVNGDDPDATACEMKGSLALDLKTTVASNLAGNDIEAAANSLRTSLLAKGYTELP
jgi:hypothetical protein